MLHNLHNKKAFHINYKFGFYSKSRYSICLLTLLIIKYMGGQLNEENSLVQFSVSFYSDINGSIVMSCYIHELIMTAG